MRMFGLAFVLLICIVPQLAVAQTPTCADAQFSDRVLQRFPKVREACLDVISQDGSYYAVFKADLLRVTSKGVQIRPALAGGKHAEPRFVQVHHDRRVMVNGEPVRFEDLALGQELTVYIAVQEPLVALAPADNEEPWPLVPLEDVEPTQLASAQEMPHTASWLPYAGALGGLLMGLGLLLGLMRKLDSRSPARD